MQLKISVFLEEKFDEIGWKVNMLIMIKSETWRYGPSVLKCYKGAN